MIVKIAIPCVGVIPYELHAFRFVPCCREAWLKDQKRKVPCAGCRHGFLSTKLGGLCGDVGGPECPNRPRHG